MRDASITLSTPAPLISRRSRRFDTSALAESELLSKQRLDRLEGADLTALDLLDQMVEDLECARHAQGDQVMADPLDRRLHQRLALHGCAPAARRRPTAS